MRVILPFIAAAALLGAVPVQAQTARRAAPAAPAGEYQGGAGSPYSASATNLPGARHGELGARLPSPTVSADTPEGYLASAATALDRNQTGAAQQALEMAETRALSRTIDPSEQGQQDQAQMVKQIGMARQALGRRDMAGAKAAIRSAMAAPTPGRGPSTTTTYSR